MPHCTPPFVPPLPTRVRQIISPRRSGSSAYTIPDFCPANSTSRPFGSFSSSTAEPKSKSGPGHPLPVHTPLKISPGVICRNQAIRPLFASSAITASLISVAGDEKLSPVATYNIPRLASSVGVPHTLAPDGPQLPTPPFSIRLGVSRIVYVFQTCVPSFARRAVTLPRNVQQAYSGLLARVSSHDAAGMKTMPLACAAVPVSRVDSCASGLFFHNSRPVSASTPYAHPIRSVNTSTCVAPLATTTGADLTGPLARYIHHKHRAPKHRRRPERGHVALKPIRPFELQLAHLIQPDSARRRIARVRCARSPAVPIRLCLPADLHRSVAAISFPRRGRIRPVYPQIIRHRLAFLPRHRVGYVDHHAEIQSPQNPRNRQLLQRLARRSPLGPRIVASCAPLLINLFARRRPRPRQRRKRSQREKNSPAFESHSHRAPFYTRPVKILSKSSNMAG